MPSEKSAEASDGSVAVEQMDDAALADLASSVAVFAKVSPAQKARVIGALHSKGHVVGFLGDGINDGPALKAADVGISVDSAVDIAKESADIILLEKSLMVLEEGRHRRPEGVRQYRQVHQDGRKLELRQHVQRAGREPVPALPADAADPGADQQPALRLLADRHPDRQCGRGISDAPRKWDIGNILRFMLFIGPISSIFDYATFFIMLYVFNCWTQPGAVPDRLVRGIAADADADYPYHPHREDPLSQSRASPALIATSVIICAIGIALPFTPIGDALKFTPLPPLYWPIGRVGRGNFTPSPSRNRA